MNLKKKQVMKHFILLIAVALTFSCCNNDDDNHGDTLPPATQTGANTVGCLVNGEVFLPKAEGINPAVVVNYEYINGEFFFTLAFRDLQGSNNEFVSVQTSRINLEIGQTYILNKNQEEDGDYTGGGGTYGPDINNHFVTTTTKTGELTITYLDLSNSIISGTFWFDAINEEGELVEIRDGRFDYVY